MTPPTRRKCPAPGRADGARAPRATRRGSRVGLSNGSGYFYCLNEMEAKVAVGFWNYWFPKSTRALRSKRAGRGR